MYGFSPSGIFNDYVAMSINARCQSSPTYLEKNVAEFPTANLDAAIVHCLKALRESLSTGSPLTAQNCSFGYVSKEKGFEVVADEVTIQSYLDQLPQVPACTAPMAFSVSTESAQSSGSMDVDTAEPVEPTEPADSVL